MTRTPPRLSWSLVISTYDRERILRRCLALAAAQTRPPREIIVVDASPGWAATRDWVVATLAPAHPHVDWRYEPAVRRSLPAQRNQGIAMATADVLLMIDDDSLMYPDCAERIMAIYEADTEGAIAGIMATEAGQPPPELPVEPGGGSPPSAGAGAPVPAVPPLGPLRRLKDDLLVRFGVRDFLPPYDPDAATETIPAAVRHLGVAPAARLMGAYMTYRRRVLVRHRFDEVLDAYAYLEDADVSYRASRDGVLLQATGALLCHTRDAGGRLSKYTTAVLGALNAVVLHRLHSGDVGRSRAEMRPFLRKRMVVEALRDVHKRRWSLPQARGVWHALRLYDRVFAMREDELRGWYAGYQRQLVARG